MDDSLSTYFNNFNRRILSKLRKDPNSFLLDNGGIVSDAGLISNKRKETIEFDWLDDLDFTLGKINTIVSFPRTHIKCESETLLAERAKRVTNKDVVETLMMPRYWKEKDATYIPEYIRSSVTEMEYAIYENRFIVLLINKLLVFLNQKIEYLYSLSKNLNQNFVNNNISSSDLDTISKYSGFGSFKVGEKSDKYKKNDSLLVNDDNDLTDTLRRLLNAKNRIICILSSIFYNEVSKAKALSDSDVYATNMLIDDPNYAPCYLFYLKLLTLISEQNEQKSKISLVDYHNFVLINLFTALRDLGFSKISNTEKNFEVLDNDLIVLKDFSFTNDNFILHVSSSDEQSIILTFEISYSESQLNRVLNLKRKRTSTVYIGLEPLNDDNFEIVDNKIKTFEKFIEQKMKENYSNAFIVTNMDGVQKDDIIICSPNIFKVNCNLSTLIKSCLIVMEANSFIYGHSCPVCGGYISGESEDGNYYCNNCESIYTIISNGNKEKRKETIWIKRLKNLSH